MSPARTNEERSRTTRTRLIAAGRQLFAEQGYAATSMTQVARTAQLSTGALYHHWPTKPELLASVVDAIHHDLACEITREIARHAPLTRDPLARIQQAAEVFLARCATRDVAQILLVDGPSVLGATWIELDHRWWHAPTMELLDEAVDNGALVAADSALLASALLGSLTALGRAFSTDPADERLRAARATLATLIDGLRTRG
ncbi:MAG TPA: helix-turn-helix domain-containing protein [Pseudonocardia sp.]|jgi:AcrR family transcriptional regulator|nr:helix-turn-helix domain-containing protein [Pseudonocardia sp.]